MVLTDLALQTTSFVVIDFETITPARRRPQPIDVATLVLDPREGGLVEVSRFKTLIRPPDGLGPTPFDTAQTGITSTMLDRAPSAAEALADLDTSLPRRPCVLVAHNAAYEAGLLFDQRQFCPTLAGTPLLDTLRLARHAYPYLSNHRLDTLLHHLRIPTPPNRHRAMPDVDATARLFDRLLTSGHWHTLDDLTDTAGLIPKAAKVDRRAHEPTQTSLFD